MTDAPRVLHLGRDLPPRSSGGMSTALGWLRDRMAEEGWPQAVVSFDGWRPRRQADRVERDGAVLRVQGRPWEAVRAFVREHEPRWLLVHDPLIDRALPDLPGRRALFVHVDHQRLRQVRGLDQPTASERALAKAAATAERVLAPSAAVVDRLRERGIADVRLARLGVDPPPAPRSVQGRDVVFVGRFDTAKGTDVLLRAMEGLPPPILAGGLPHNPRAEARWRERWPRARWRGWLNPEQRDALLASAAVVVVPSLEETLGLVALEALRLGVPVIGSDVGGLAEILRDAGAPIVPPGDVKALRAAIVALLGDPGRRAALGDAGRRAVAERWTWAALRGGWGEGVWG